MILETLSYELLVVIGMLLGITISICLCGYERMQHRNDDLVKPFKDNEKVSKVGEIEVNEKHSIGQFCACKPGDYPHCLLEGWVSQKSVHWLKTAQIFSMAADYNIRKDID